MENASPSVPGNSDTPAAGSDNVVPGKAVDTKTAQSKAAAPVDPKAALTKKLTPEPPKADKVAEEKKETPEQRRIRLKYKVDGAEKEEEFDEPTLVKKIQMAEAAQKRMAESAQLKKDLVAFVEQVKANPIEALKDPVFGLDLKEMVRAQLLEEYQQSLASPEEQEKLARDKELQEYKAKLQKYEEEKAQAEQAQYQAKVDQEVRGTMKQVMDIVRLPYTRHTAYLVGQVMRERLYTDGLNMTPEQLAAEVESRATGQITGFLGDLDGEALAKRLGDDVVRKLVNYKVAQMRAKAPAAAPPAPEKPVISPKDAPEPEKKRRMSPEEKAAYMRSLMMGD